MEMYENAGTTATPAVATDGSAGFQLDRPDNYEPPILESV